ncbi:putative histone lysine methyltransferase, SET [Besnoitia besnoiti]|uniref:Putative histone lysine methyltransferase, SET n=1 Tax=Besnoitia besnoiti TaxID=94643 RepID=A0A2A9M5E2_BESBE|nr:putative histone lysine methyltransferase, SET [Besnoitia besnoiti]PFH31521.1 putative histone lysine methyltransferase, SET [Besnoitia besnoiti]
MFDTLLRSVVQATPADDSGTSLAEIDKAADRALRQRLQLSRQGAPRSPDAAAGRGARGDAPASQDAAGEEAPSSPVAAKAATRRFEIAAEGAENAEGDARLRGRRQGIVEASPHDSSHEGSPGGQSAVGRGMLRRDLGRSIDDHEEERRRQEEELEVLRTTVPQLIGKHQYSDAEALLHFYLDSFPRFADLYVLAAEVYVQQKKYDQAIEMYWGALFCSPDDRTVVRSLRAVEELRLAQVTRIPHVYKAALFDSGGLAYFNCAGAGRGAEANYFSRLLTPFLRGMRESGAAGRGAQGTGGGGGRNDSSSMNLPFIVVRQEKKAMCIAEVAFEPGQLVCRQLPFVSTPVTLEGSGSHIFTTCFHCLRERRVPDRGFSCPISPHTCPFVFCSWECLMRNIRVHSLECQLLPMIMAAAREAGLGVTAVFHVCRALLRAGLERQVVPPQQDTLFQVVGELQSYSDSVKFGQPELYRKLSTLARRIQKEFPPSFYCYLQQKELIDVMLILSQYSPFVHSTSPSSAVQRRDPDASIGLVFSQVLANFHHSCVPTCTYSLDEDGYVSVRALCHIPVGGRLCISMVEDLFTPAVARKGVDALPRVFGCGCVRCSDPSEGGRMLRGVRCVVCLRGYCSPFKSRALQKRLQAYGVGGAEVARRIGVLEDAAGSGDGGGGAGDGAEGSASRNGSLSRKQSGARRGRRVEEIWQCGRCGNSSDYLAVHCAALEAEVAQLAKKAERRLVRGEKLPAQKLYVDIIRQFSSRLHPNHFLLYNAEVIAAGLLSRNPRQDVPQALVYIRRAVIAAEAVLPICHREKIHLYNKLAQITFAASMVDKLTRRGAGPPSGLVLEPMYASLWNAAVCCGPRSTVALTAIQQLRTYAAALEVATPPAMISVKVSTFSVFLSYYRKVLGRQTDSEEAIRRAVETDPFQLAATIARLGLDCPMSMEILAAFNHVHHLASGLSIMAIAASQSRLGLVRKLLDVGFDFLRGNEMGVTPLLAMAAMPLPAGAVPALGSAAAVEMENRAVAVEEEAKGGVDLSQRRLQLRSAAADRADRDQAEIVRLFLRECARRDEKDRYKKWKDMLMKACTHQILGMNGPLHFAAARGKRELCRQLIRSGWSVKSMNGEGATPLHLACYSGDVQTVEELLAPRVACPNVTGYRGGAEKASAGESEADLNAKTERGETPLMLAAYALQRDMVRLLLERGADANVVGQRDQMTVLHALAIGVCRNFEVQYEPLDLRQTLEANVVMGFNPGTLAANIYNKSPAYLQVTDCIDDRIPVVSRLSPDLLIFPQEMLKRLKAANSIGGLLIRYCDQEAYARQTKKGFSASELLAHLWERFFQLRNVVVTQSELRLAALSYRERQDIEAGWKAAGQLVFRLVELLRSGGVRVEAIRSAGEITPRRQDLVERRRKQLERDAPWVLMDEILKKKKKAELAAPVLKGASPAPDAKAAAGAPKEDPKKALGPPGLKAPAAAEGAEKKEEGAKASLPAKGPPPPGGAKGPPPPGGAKGPPPPGGAKGPPPPGGAKGPPPPGGAKGPPPPGGAKAKGPPLPGKKGPPKLPPKK